jgi:RNA polymerase primary sigma factor
MKRRNDTQKDTLQQYFSLIKKQPLLSFEEELELSRRIQAGDEEARTTLAEANLRLVIKIARSYAHSSSNLVDLIQEGNLGLLKAVEKYDWRKNVRFSTYAAWWIRQSIVRALAKNRNHIRLPHRKEELLKKVRHYVYTYVLEHGEEPSNEHIADQLGVSSKDVDLVLSSGDPIVSLDWEEEESESTLTDMYEDITYEPSQELLQQSMRDDTLRFLSHLRERERQILMYRFAFYGGRKLTLKRIGDEMGISPETVRQIEKKALATLKEHAEEIREYVYG